MSKKTWAAIIIGSLTLAAGVVAVSCSSAPAARSLSSGEDDQWKGTGNLDSPAAAERAGCCNGHGGACGCGSGKVQCCDGSASDRCGCE